MEVFLSQDSIRGESEDSPSRSTMPGQMVSVTDVVALSHDTYDECKSCQNRFHQLGPAG